MTTDQEFLDYYGLQTAPFAPISDPEKCFEPPSWEEQLDLLQHLTRYGHEVLALTGEAGCGKSTLIQLLEARLSPLMPVAVFDADEKNSIEALSGFIIQQFHIKNTPSSSSVSALVEKIQQAGRHVALVIDHADNLPQSVLENCLEAMVKQQTGIIRFHLILVGTPGIEKSAQDTLNRFGEGSSLHTLLLQPFDVGETKSYCQYQFQQAGAQRTLPLSDAMIATIYKNSNGYPGKIGTSARAIMEQNMPNQKNGNTTMGSILSLSKQHGTKIIGALVITLALISAIVIQNSINKKIKPTQTPHIVSTPTPKLIGSSDTKSIQPIIKKLPSPIIIPKAEAKKVERKKINLEKIKPSIGHMVITKSKTTKPEITKPEITKLEITKPKITKLEITKPKVSKPKITKKIINKPKVLKKIIAKKPVFTATERDLLKVNPKDFAVQLIALRDKKRLARFITENKLNNKTYSYPTILKNKKWYVLIQGPYKNMSQAEASIRKLPSKLIKLKPWVRQYSYIHKDIMRLNKGIK